MEDLKKIQEFFSKPLNEVSGNIDIEDFAKVVQAISQTDHPVTVLLNPMFGKNEIEIVIGMDAPDPIGDAMFNIMDELGYRRGDYSIVGDTSTLSRREYSQIRRINGGHKNYRRFFEESVNEGGIEDIQKKLDALGVKYEMSKTDKVRPFKAIYRPINKSDEFYDKFEDIVDLANLKGVVKTSMDEATKEEENEFHTKLDKLVHKTFGHSSDEKKKEMNEAYVPSNIAEFAKRRGISSLVRKVAGWAERVGARITGGTAIGYGYNTLILDLGYQTGDIRIDVEDETIELYDEPVYSFADFKNVFMEEVTRQQAEHDEEQLRRERGLEEKAAYIAETIKLGLMLNEELCEKGKRYIKARQAAGEKSSAYLSGRAVRVCKGQIEWPKKGKKK